MTPKELALAQIKSMLECPEIVLASQNRIFKERKLLAWRVNMGITGEINDYDSKGRLSDSPGYIQTVLWKSR